MNKDKGSMISMRIRVRELWILPDGIQTLDHINRKMIRGQQFEKEITKNHILFVIEILNKQRFLSEKKSLWGRENGK
jgi:predicted ABC-class ATPase